MQSALKRALVAGVAAALLPLSVQPVSAAGSARPTDGAASAERVRAPAAEPKVADEATGRWRVSPAGPGRWVVSWTSPRDLPITDARPEFALAGEPIGAPEQQADGRTLRLEVAADERPRAEDLDVLLSGRVLDGPQPTAPAPGLLPYAEPPSAEQLLTDPAEPGTHEVEASTYRLPGLKLPGMQAEIEVLGRVIAPADADATSPLVLFLHGRHAPCYGKPTGPGTREWPCPVGMKPIPSHLGYRYIQRVLATQGYVTVSISANGINAQDWRLDDGGAEARARLIRHHLGTWAAWASEADPPYVADVHNVVLVGHSRGGEGANRASLSAPLSAPYRIVGQTLIGPTDFGRQTAPYVPTLTMLPYCDGDVADLQGQMFTDLARDAAADDTALHSSALMMGANHNFFNIEWTPGIAVAPAFDDWWGDPDKTCGVNTDQRLTAEEQRAVGLAWVAGAVHLMASDEQDLLPMFDGSAVTVPSAGDADVRTHLVGAGRDVRRMGTDAFAGATSEAETQMCLGVVDRRPPLPTDCGRGVEGVRAPHWMSWFPAGLQVRNFEMGWTTADAWGRIRLREPLDLSDASRLDLRTIVDQRAGGVRLDVRLRDADGRSRIVTPDDDGRLPALPRGDYLLGKRWAQTLRVPLTGTGPVDLSRIVAIDLIGRSPDGLVWVLDVSAAHDTLPAVPEQRMSLVSLGSVVVDEGDGPEPTIARVPYTVRGPVPADAKIVVLVNDWWSGYAPRVVRVPIDASSGFVPVPVEADTRDDLDRRLWVVAYAVRGVMTWRYTGGLTVNDDDPTPRMSLVVPRQKVAEGEAAKWRVELARPVDYWVDVRAKFVKGGRDLPRLRVGDLRPTWVERYLGDPPEDRLLHRLKRGLWSFIEADRTRTAFEVPIRRDGVKEGREVVTLRVRTLGQVRQEAVVVTGR